MEDMSTSLLAPGVLHIAAARLEHLEKFRSSWDMKGRANSRRRRAGQVVYFVWFIENKAVGGEFA
jgi:hypothetical protein